MTQIATLISTGLRTIKGSKAWQLGLAFLSIACVAGAWQAIQPAPIFGGLQHGLILNGQRAPAKWIDETSQHAERVIVATVVVDWLGDLAPVDVNYSALATNSTAIALQVKFLGQLEMVQFDKVERAIQQSLQQANQAGIKIWGVDIDYRGSKKNLSSYVSLVERWRATLIPSDLKLSSSAMLSWVNTSEVSDLSEVCDELILHAEDLTDPNIGLFNDEILQAALPTFSRKTKKSFWIWLPAGGQIIMRDDEQRLVGTEEFPPDPEVMQTRKVRAVTLGISPSAMQRFVRQLNGAHPKNLKGALWQATFPNQKPPAWSTHTWVALVDNIDISPKVAFQTTYDKAKAWWTISASNQSETDLDLPESLLLSPDCAYVVPESPYAPFHDPTSGQIGLQRKRIRTFAPKQVEALGHAKCSRQPTVREIPLQAKP